MRQTTLLAAGLVIAVGVLMGIGAFTFAYARGYSYLSDDPKVCVNCHIMRDNYNSWIASSHRSVNCNGCHVPHQIVEKYLIKGEQGMRHSYAFTFADTQAIRIKSTSLEVVERNCAECHREMIMGTFLDVGSEPKGCTKCHQGAGHPF